MDGGSLQQRYAPESSCFGCGPANAKGMRIGTHEGSHGELIAEWHPEPHHAAFTNVLNGGVIGTLLDCHANWAAAMYLMHERALDGPPGCVTAEYSIKLRRPTPTARSDASRSHRRGAVGDPRHVPRSSRGRGVLDARRACVHAARGGGRGRSATSTTGTEPLMKLVRTLLVRNEADIVDAQIAFHLSAGVDFVIATDNRSDDGTTEILERYERAGFLRLLREDGDDMRQDEWVTRMARLAATDGLLT